MAQLFTFPGFLAAYDDVVSEENKDGRVRGQALTCDDR